MKGTCKDNVENDLYAALYYLNLVSPSTYGDLPRIVAAYPEEYLFENNNHDDTRIEKSHLTKPSHPIALRYFYHAELLWGEECLLYYYKVLEHFFEYVWRLRIIDLVLECGEDIEKLAQALARHQPRSEKDYLYLVLERIENEKMWNYVTLNNFSGNNLGKLTKSVYRVRNKVAHGKELDNFEAIAPSIISDLEIRKDIAILRFLAELALTKLGNVDSVHNSAG